MNKGHHKVRVFTDGACSGNPGPGGWGFMLLLPDKNIRKHGYELYTTNNRMELTAVIKALEKAKGAGYNNIEIHSDSSYVVNGVLHKWTDTWIANRWRTSSGGTVKNKDLWLKLTELLGNGKSKCSITFHKVKGHVGNTFNEIADEEAKAGVEEAKKMLRKAGAI